LPDFTQNGRIGPRRIAHKMQQRLMVRRCPLRCYRGSHRFNALAARLHEQALAVAAQRLRTVFVAQNACQRLDIGFETRFTLLDCLKVHSRGPCSLSESLLLADSPPEPPCGFVTQYFVTQ